MGYPSYYISMLGDVSVTNVKSCKKALEWNYMALAAANARDQDKIRKWDPQCKAVGMRFEPLSFEAQGALGSGVRRMLKYAEKAFAKEEETLNGTASNATDEDGFTKKTWLAPTEYQYRLQRLVVALARWNSRMIGSQV